ncbi:hypothetical protein CD006_26275 [Enterobacter sp. 10-1]|nr:hypothetical protein CD006_26275 [Enterobacter sp. 10-1]
MFSGLCLSLYPAGAQEGFPRRRLTSVLRNKLMEVPDCADTLIVAHPLKSTRLFWRIFSVIRRQFL